jgi:molybdopterin molybdotransferase
LSIWLEVRVGEAARMYTEAMIPLGADGVILQENCRRIGDQVSIFSAPGTKLHLRLRGEDVLARQRVLTAGTRIRPNELALLHALQMDHLPVLRKLRAALLSTGDELQEGQREVGTGRVVDSNSQCCGVGSRS